MAFESRTRDRQESGTGVDQKQNEIVVVVLEEITLKLSLTLCPVQIYTLLIFIGNSVAKKEWFYISNCFESILPRRNSI